MVVTGVSGSGKSTLVRECLLPALPRLCARAKRGQRAGRRQSAISHPARLPASNPSRRSTRWINRPSAAPRARSRPPTSGSSTISASLFAQVPEARLRGYGPGRFSFNSAQGRCPECEGAGTIKLEMNFLPPAFVRCEICGGCRFNRETLDIEYGGKNIAQVLDLSVEEAMDFFASLPEDQARARRRSATPAWTI